MAKDSTSQHKILVVDDTQHNLRLLSRILTKKGYDVEAAMDGPAALEAVEASPPDLILLDIHMPEMDGYEVCRRLKADTSTEDIPIIFISALDEVMDKVKAFKVGGVDYIPKPFHVEEVLARINTQLRLRRLQQELEASNKRLEQKVAERTAELVELNRTYEYFIPSEFLSLLKKDSITDVAHGDQVQRKMTVMFSDIRDFTMFSENMSPQENFNFLNSYLSRVSPVIRQHAGFIDKYIGDAILALFPGDAEDALRAAIEMRYQLAEYNQHRRNSGYRPIKIGTSLHKGSLMLGIIGEEERMQGTVISDVVNTAARMEELTKLYGASIVISEQTLDSIVHPETYNFRFLDNVQVKGKRETISVFENFDGDPETIVELKLETKETFEHGVQLYQDGQMAEARMRFETILQKNPDDIAAQLYLQRVDGDVPHHTLAQPVIVPAKIK